MPHSVAQSVVSNRKTSTVNAGKHGGKDPSSTTGPGAKGAATVGASTAEAAGSSQVGEGRVCGAE